MIKLLHEINDYILTYIDQIYELIHYLLVCFTAFMLFIVIESLMIALSLINLKGLLTCLNVFFLLL